MLLLFLLILVFPIVIYVYSFGFHLSSDHQRWSEFGSAISGIYSPLIAFIALLILFAQFKAQVSINEHQYDQTYIQENRKELNYYIEKMEEALDKHYQGQEIRIFLIDNFAFATEEQLKSAAYQNTALDIHAVHPKIQNLWIAIYPILNGLGSIKRFPYEHNFSSSVLRISTMLSFNACVAIDNYYYCLTNDLQKGNYYFRDKNDH